MKPNGNQLDSLENKLDKLVEYVTTKLVTKDDHNQTLDRLERIERSLEKLITTVDGLLNQLRILKLNIQ